jgi:hypothetical protein
MPAEPAIGPREYIEQLQELTAGGIKDEPGLGDDICYAIGLFTKINSKNGIVRPLQGFSGYKLE